MKSWPAVNITDFEYLRRIIIGKGSFTNVKELEISKNRFLERVDISCGDKSFSQLFPWKTIYSSPFTHTTKLTIKGTNEKIVRIR